VGWLRRKSDTIAIIFGIVIGLTAAAYGFLRSNRAPLSQREMATRVLAEYVRKTAKPKAVLIIGNPFSQTPGRPAELYSFEKASEAGLRKGFGPEVEVKIAFPKLKPEAERDASSVFVDPTTTTPLSYLVAADAFDLLAREHSECEVFVSLIGLPVNTGLSAFWLKPGPPRFALLLPDFKVVGEPNAIRAAFTTGKITAAVILKPGVSLPDNAAGSDDKSEFDKRFILVTAENIDQSLRLLLR